MTRCFDDEASYNTWLEYTTKNGNDMKSFYMIRKMSQTYSAKQRDESFQEL